ncbi:sulfurtransferase [Streptomonospora nanhaiensis]|uniref:Thiosulfate/3-mercaptopyruvate sulfurtransferase n=1 Tax=Streptomonospora nanhaiensis TaxID=1323731 RepID=A0A853BRJ3_9ACTN|nr:sulfurtransferase [Streptomonospora nanhaiensis]MBV2363819.1 sulfurtransferase [Streptomonospora nanhaiensis]MBX9388788.1 sulfurtransferase [Streptomonospora nanhaiensis]NYI97610.1 thiosulfate/3-mercaptopyruvate sulfurtransferase [Streptomonospora nanhaiensis]
MTTNDGAPGLPVLVSAEWLAEHHGDVLVADVRFYLDGRSAREEYLRGHLPGAVFVDVDHDLSAPAREGTGRHPLPDPDTFAATLARLGIGDGTPVVGYDDVNGSVAARLVWMLRALGSPAALLDGGIAAWRGELATGPVEPAPRPRTPVVWPADRIVDTETVLAEAGDPRHVLVDARTRERYTGEAPAPVDLRPGHIPGARSAAWAGNLAEDGRFAAPERLRERFRALGVDTADTVTAYCGSGVTACHDLLALELAGYSGARLYPGSWSAWAPNPDLPAETGDGSG